MFEARPEVTRGMAAARRHGMGDASRRIGDYSIDRQLAGDELVAHYVVTHAVLPRRAQLRIVRHDGPAPRSAGLRVIREACILEALHHASVPRVFECGRIGDRAWFAYEHVEGDTLAAILELRALSIADVVALVRDVADALAHAHSRGVIHRGVCADAIVRRQDGNWCVVDWHDARAERAGGSDVRALGVLAHEALAGRRAPAALTDLLDAMLAADPDTRPAAAEVTERAAHIASDVAETEVEQVEIVLVADTLRERVSDYADLPHMHTTPRWTPAAGVPSPVPLARVATQRRVIKVSRVVDGE
jgi:tRNA A-37 threonylcarbamoyl transferase component Bud32